MPLSVFLTVLGQRCQSWENNLKGEMFPLLMISDASAQGHLVPSLWASLMQDITVVGEEMFPLRWEGTEKAWDRYTPRVHPCDSSFQWASPPKVSVPTQECHCLVYL